MVSIYDASTKHSLNLPHGAVSLARTHARPSTTTTATSPLIPRSARSRSAFRRKGRMRKTRNGGGNDQDVHRRAINLVVERVFRKRTCAITLMQMDKRVT